MNAGADAIFVEALENADEFAEFAKQVRVPLLANMTEFGKSPLLDATTLGQMGYAMVLYPLTAFRSAMKAAQVTLQMVANEDHQRSAIGDMLTRAELYDLLGYAGYEQRDRSYFG
jgi:methylisocitrate lyase